MVVAVDRLAGRVEPGRSGRCRGRRRRTERLATSKTDVADAGAAVGADRGEQADGTGGAIDPYRCCPGPPLGPNWPGIQMALARADLAASEAGCARDRHLQPEGGGSAEIDVRYDRVVEGDREDLTDVPWLSA
ncbi:MAG: hypothetical protein WDM84_05905 [Bauldia sp.]